MSDEALKHCNKCGKHEPNAEFYPSFKHRNICKGCHGIQRNVWRKKNPGKEAAAAREKYRRDPEQGRKRSRDYKQKNKEKVAEQFAIRYKNDPDRFRGYTRRWRAENPKESAQTTRASQKRLQDASLDGAVRSGYEWTGWEMEIAGDLNRSVKEVARVIGRTYAAAAHMRHKVLTHPKWISVAGLGQAQERESGDR